MPGRTSSIQGISSAFVCRPGQDLIPRLRRVGVLSPDLLKCFINVDIVGVFVRTSTLNKLHRFYIFEWTPGSGNNGCIWALRYVRTGKPI